VPCGHPQAHQPAQQLDSLREIQSCLSMYPIPRTPDVLGVAKAHKAVPECTIKTGPEATLADDCLESRWSAMGKVTAVWAVPGHLSIIDHHDRLSSREILQHINSGSCMCQIPKPGCHIQVPDRCQSPRLLLHPSIQEHTLNTFPYFSPHSVYTM
jgi:hypothetical protein